jgi:hypothetical protein
MASEVCTADQKKGQDDFTQKMALKIISNARICGGGLQNFCTWRNLC